MTGTAQQIPSTRCLLTYLPPSNQGSPQLSELRACQGAVPSFRGLFVTLLSEYLPLRSLISLWNQADLGPRHKYLIHRRTTSKSLALPEPQRPAQCLGNSRGSERVAVIVSLLPFPTPQGSCARALNKGKMGVG